MKYKIGDKVRFLNEKGEGLVTRIINKTTVGVTIEDGFELPFLETELVSIFDGQIEVVLKQEPKEESVQVYAVQKEKREEQVEGIYIAISPERPEDIAHSGFNLWIINHSSYEICYSISSLSSEGFNLIDKGDVEPYRSNLVETVDKKRLEILATLKVEALYFNSKSAFEHRQPLSEVLKLRTVKFYKENTFIENSFIPENAYIIEVENFSEELYFDSPEAKKIDLSKVLLQKRSNTAGRNISKPHRKNDPSLDLEIDIHVEELADNWNGMSNAEIVQLQLRHFQNALDKAINEHYRTLTVIHGVGNGRLKQEVRNILSKMNLKFHDASYSKYGFGATEVVIG